MIVSASYRTDIPAFYSAWFLNRLRAGGCQVVNPYSGATYDIDLRPAAVDGFVFWTKNLGPLLPYLGEVRSRGNPFVAQYTITGYPRELEERVVGAERAIGHMRALAEEYGGAIGRQRVSPAVWRYDPILVTNLTPLAWHIENFAHLAGRLQGTTDEVVFSFAHLYQKTRRNLASKREDAGVDWSAHEAIMGAASANGQAPQEARDLIATLADIAHEHGMSLRGCSQPEFLIPGVEPAHCVDSARLIDVARAWGIQPSSGLLRTKEKGNRPGCACSTSRDIGEYDTCPHGCVYCYAVRHRALALDRYRRHDPDSPFLFAPPERPQPPNAAPRRSRPPLPALTPQQLTLLPEGE